MLEASQTYKLVDTNPDSGILTELRKLKPKHERNLTKGNSDYLLNFESKTSNFYGLSKVHKSKQIASAMLDQNSEYIVVQHRD